ncbi:hypothetical protein BH18ACI4_BH18ACI4_23850 [soil metagenome]
MLLENSGIIPQLASDPAQVPLWRRSGIIRESVFLTLLAWAIGLALTLLWDSGGPFESVAKVGSLVFFIVGLAGLLRFLYAFLFVEDIVASPSQTTLAGPTHSLTMPENPTRAALPSPPSAPVSDYVPRNRTREIVSQPSVTENTTRLLDDRDN